MEVIYYRLLKVDNTANIVTVENFANEQNIYDYIWELITNCVDSDGDREYIFESTLITMQNHIDKIITNSDRDDICVQIANKLLVVENDTKEQIARLIQR